MLVKALMQKNYVYTIMFELNYF